MDTHYAVRARLVPPELVERLEVLAELLDVEPEPRALQDRQDVPRSLPEGHDVVRLLLADLLPGGQVRSLRVGEQQPDPDRALVLRIAQDRVSHVVEEFAVVQLDLAALAVAAAGCAPEDVESRETRVRRRRWLLRGLLGRHGLPDQERPDLLDVDTGREQFAPGAAVLTAGQRGLRHVVADRRATGLSRPVLQAPKRRERLDQPVEDHASAGLKLAVLRLAPIAEPDYPVDREREGLRRDLVVAIAGRSQSRRVHVEERADPSRRRLGR